MYNSITLARLKEIISPSEMQKVYDAINSIDITVPKTLWAVFDGGAEPHRGIYGSFYINTSPPILERYDFTHPKETNNVAEYMALTALLEFLLEHGMYNISIFGDSMLVVKQVNGKWRSKTEHLTMLRDRVWELLEGFESWSLEWRRRDLAVKYLGH